MRPQWMADTMLEVGSRWDGFRETRILVVADLTRIGRSCSVDRTEATGSIVVYCPGFGFDRCAR